jgi:hypothetical protein
MSPAYLRGSCGWQRDHGGSAPAGGIEIHRVPLALLIAAVALVAGVGSDPAQSVEVRPLIDRPAVQERASAASAALPQAKASLLRRLPPLSMAPAFRERKQACRCPST